jgi:DNA-binding transcriptional LysR family regulator
MLWRLGDVAAFLRVVETGNVTAAARRLNLSKSVVSKRIADLEAALGVTLLHRSTRHVVPTEKGTAFYRRMSALLQEADNAIQELVSGDKGFSGTLRITVPLTFAVLHLWPVLLDFAKRHSAVELAVDLDDRVVDLVGGGYDLAVRIGRPADSSLIARRLCSSRRVVCASPDYLRRRGHPKRIDDLSEHECIDYANVHSSKLWQFMSRRAGPRSVVMRSRICANNGEVMRDAVIAGFGLAILPLFIAADALRDGRLVVVLPDAVPVPDTVNAMYPPARHVPPRVRALIDHLVAAFANRLPWEAGLESVWPEFRAGD